MIRARELGLEVKGFPYGEPALLAGIIDYLEIPELINAACATHQGATGYQALSPGTVAKLLLVFLCAPDHNLSYSMEEYFAHKDMSVLAGANIHSSVLTDELFGDLLDQLYRVGPRSLLISMAAQAFSKYDLSIQSLNYDTTCKTAWGYYETEVRPLGGILMSFGQSKSRREYESQIDISIGSTDGIIVDAKLVPDNTNASAASTAILDDVDAILNKHCVDRGSFYYVAHAAHFTPEIIKKLDRYSLFFITQVPDTDDVARDLVAQAWSNPADFVTVEHPSSKGSINYRVQDFVAEYQGYAMKLAVCHTPTLEKKQRSTVDKQVQKELAQIEKVAEPYATRTFATSTHALQEINVLADKLRAKVQYHTVEFRVVQEDVNGQNRLVKDALELKPEGPCTIEWQIDADPSLIDGAVQRAATFVLVSNDFSLSAEQLLAAHKAHSGVANRFRQLRSPHLVMLSHLSTPQRIEAMNYLILTAIMILAVVEKVVRRKMALEDATIIGPGGVVMAQPSLRAILDTFHYLTVTHLKYQQEVTKQVDPPLNESQLKILRYLGLQPSLYTGGS